MEKKRKREKTALNGALVLADVHTGLQDASLKELEHKDGAEAASAAVPLPFHHPWHAAAAAAAAANAHQHQQAGSHPQEGHRTVAVPAATVPPPPPPYCWPFGGEFQHPPRPFYPVPQTTSTTEWQTAAANTQSNANAPPYFAGGPWFTPPYVGAPYPAFFGYPMPANPAVQKGVIKPPQGLSQKHQKLWEMQSAENVQLWITLARVEAEMAAQRSKITQLETDLQALKASRQENPSTDAAIAAAPLTTTQAAPKRGRYKKTVIGNIPPEAIAPRPRGRKPASDKPSLAKKAAEKGRLAAAAKAEGNPAAACTAAPGALKQCNKENGIHDNCSKQSSVINFGTDTEKMSFVSHSNIANWTQANGSVSQEEDDDEILF